MLTAQQREVAETAFDRNKRRKTEINDALRQEQARHKAAVKNMQRLRALRLERDTKKKAQIASRRWTGRVAETSALVRNEFTLPPTDNSAAAGDANQDRPSRYPLYPRKRSFIGVGGMSALCQKQTYAAQQSLLLSI